MPTVDPWREVSKEEFEGIKKSFQPALKNKAGVLCEANGAGREILKRKGGKHFANSLCVGSIAWGAKVLPMKVRGG